MKLLAFTKYDKIGPSSRVRFYQYIPFLQQIGFSVQVQPLLNERYIHRLYLNGARSSSELVKGYIRRCCLLLKHRNHDLVWIEKELFPWLPEIDLFYRSILSKPYIVDYDDAIFHLYDLHRYKIVQKFLGEKIDRIMRGANAVTVGNKYLEERAKAAGAKSINILPTSVDTNRYKYKPKNNGKITVGWIGTPVTEKYLDIIKRTLRILVEKDPDIEIVLVGASRNALRGVRTRLLEWTEDTEVKSIQSFDIGIMPLRDNPFERGKCGYKIIQCMACGIPVVASPVGVNQEIIDHGKNGYLAGTENDWLHHLIELRNRKKMRIHMGQNAIAKIKEKYSLSQTEPILYKVLRDALKT